MFKDRTSKQKTGDQAETRARRYLEKQGLQLVTSNFRCNSGEIDLIMRHGNHLVFVEVRCRASNHYGDAAETVGFRKQRKLIRTAQYYLQQNRIDRPCRFDVVALTAGRLDWIPDAFTL